MLRNLHVKNLALIDEAEVDFTKGLNILSGETGAGKSIIIGSVNLALGEKVPREMLRENAEYALVELIFDVTNPETIAQLADIEVYPENDAVILSRKITNGRSIARINAESVPAAKMREVAALLIDIHGQHDHQSLLQKRKHLEILDDFARDELEATKQKLADKYHEYVALREEANAAEVDEEERMRELSLLEYEVHEIETAKLTVGEDEQLEADYRRMSHGRKIMEALSSAYAMTGGDGECAGDQTGRALRELNAVEDYDDKVHELAEELGQIDNLLNDFNRELSDYMGEADYDEEVFAETEQRLDEVNHLKAKYGKSIEIILTSLEERSLRIERLRDYDTYRQGLQEKLAHSEKELEKLCMQVSKIRQRFAKKLTELVAAALVDLNFLDVQFVMDFKRMDHYTANGYDDAEFLISTNPGEPVKPLGKIASGGELSRVMLAIKAVLAQNDAIGTLIFDEIDAGISGRTAQMVSEKMNVIGKEHQVICITHLPQIAAMADAHYLIEKEVQNKSTISKIRRLNEDESVAELARMLGGVKITDTVMQSAREMKELAQTTKNS